MKKLISVIMSLAVLGSMTTMTANAVTPNTITSPDTQGSGNVLMSGTTISAPSYTVTIPEKIEFGSVKKVVKNTPNDTAIVKTAYYQVSAEYQHLFENQKRLSVALSSDGMLVNGANSISYEMYLCSRPQEIENGDKIIDVNLTDKNTDVDQSLLSFTTMFATLDQRLIKASGDYTGTVTFTVALTDVE